MNCSPNIFYISIFFTPYNFQLVRLFFSFLWACENFDFLIIVDKNVCLIKKLENRIQGSYIKLMLIEIKTKLDIISTIIYYSSQFRILITNIVICHPR